MRYLSVCSGIEAATCAWHPLGWTPWAFSEIEKFPSAVLAHHYPSVPNLGDMTRFEEWPDATVDVLVGGTPCQSFSVAGLRKGLDDPRGNLMLVYLAIARRYRPDWLVWENVPGVLSSAGGRDFAALLRGLDELGYGWAYRVLDAQYFGVPQRRRRVFVVGCARGWRRAAAVLFERHCLEGHPAPSRKAREGVAPTIAAGTRGGGGLGTDFDCDGGLIPSPHTMISPALKARDSKGPSSDGDGDGAILVPMVTHSLRADGFDASEDGTGRRTPLVPVAFHNRQDPDMSGDVTHPLGAKDNGMAVAFDVTGTGPGVRTGARETDVHTALRGRTPGVSEGSTTTFISSAMQVRRLTPRECERLQGFPDDYTLIPYRGKPAADGPRYKALGNSMAVPCMVWIGKRIAIVERISRACNLRGTGFGRR